MRQQGQDRAIRPGGNWEVETSQQPNGSWECRLLRGGVVMWLGWGYVSRELAEEAAKERRRHMVVADRRREETRRVTPLD